ncbi:MAG: ribonuclease [Solirubrobacteraceae bacterium]|nr:ribonuclease [Solirubrobacteraceae bacterium]
MDALRELFDALPEPLRRQALTHASWVEHRSDSYERLALLGDSVLGLAITSHLWPLLDAERYGAGQLTKIRAQTVSGRSCRKVADRLGVPDRLRELAPEVSPANEALTYTERVLSQICEAVIAACYLEHGFEVTAAAVVEAFQPELERALNDPGDFKSALQERLARHGETVGYEVVAEEGPPHDRTFEMAAIVAGEEVARGSGRSKKDAEQAAASAALDKMVS